MAAVRAAERRAHAEALLGEIEADAGVAADAVKFAPDHVRRINPALHHQIFDQPAEVVDRQRGDHGRTLAPALAHRARDIVFAAAFPHLERTRVAHPAEAGIEAQHHLAERDAVPLRLGGRTDLEDFVGHLTCP